METNSKAVQNQKVFVELRSVLKLQEAISRNANGDEWDVRRAKGMEEAVAILGLPISIFTPDDM